MVEVPLDERAHCRCEEGGRDLRARLRETGFFLPCYGWYRGRLALQLAIFAGAFGGLLIVSTPTGRGALLALVALACVQLGTLAHDAGHRATDRRRWVNEAVGHLGMTVVNGLSFGHWRAQHDQHHRECQDELRDPDMQYAALYSVHPGSAASKRGLARLLAPWQAWYFWPTAVLGYAAALRLASLRSVSRRRRTLRLDALLLPLHYLLWIGLPSRFLGVGAALVNYAVVSTLIGASLMLLFAVNHMGMPSVPPGERWCPWRQQVETSRDVLLPRWIEPLWGGLNYQIEHHLFPSVAQPRLREAAPIVRAWCEAHGLRYRAEPMGAALIAIGRHLNAMGALTRSPLPAEAPDATSPG